MKLYLNTEGVSQHQDAVVSIIDRMIAHDPTQHNQWWFGLEGRYTGHYELRVVALTLRQTADGRTDILVVDVDGVAMPTGECTVGLESTVRPDPALGVATLGWGEVLDGVAVGVSTNHGEYGSDWGTPEVLRLSSQTRRVDEGAQRLARLPVVVAYGQTAGEPAPGSGARWLSLQSLLDDPEQLSLASREFMVRCYSPVLEGIEALLVSDRPSTTEVAL